MENKEKKFFNPVFLIALLLVMVIVGWGLLLPENFDRIAKMAFSYLVGNFGWFYVLSMTSFVAFSIYILFSKYGNIVLGDPDDEPEFSLISWFGMLFSAGMGVGLIFYGVAEPLYHFSSPLSTMVPGSEEAMNFAFKKAFFHWGLHPWANYAILALALAYMQFRKKKPGLISSVFIPLIGEERVKGPIGQTIDVLAIFATVAGVATSLGMATLQINGGLNYLFNIPVNNTVGVIIILIITFLFILTAIMGIEKGIKFVSDMNIALCALLMLVAFIVGPSVKILNTLSNSIGLYIAGLVPDSFAITADPWYGSWTIFYWAWWIAWAPFVGTFIARISRGRTIKEFMAGVLLAPTIVSFFWFSIFGTIGIEVVDKIGAFTTETAFFQAFSFYPMGKILSAVAVLLLTTFFITSANSATFVLGMFSSGGDLNPSTSKKLTWGLLQSGLATALMLAGGLGALQTGSVVAAFPFSFIMLFAMVSIIKALKNDDEIVNAKKNIEILESEEIKTN
ncbi:BCCT family transporter [Clostridiaceae bacterium HSG29]|nr:BCCT family transporter [Clostridiaceae bacterium HSG29]